MSVVHLIDTITKWAQVNICDCTRLKQPPADLEAAIDEGYEYTLVNPVAFPMYVPTSEKLPPSIHSPFPSLCVRFVTGKDTLADGEGSVKVQLCFSTWDPGTHGKDILLPNGDGSFKRWSDEEKSHFQRNGDGWRDVWNFVDIALRAVESVSFIGEYTIDRAQPIEFGPMMEQESIPDFYPMWFAWVSFTINYPLRRNMQDLKNFL